MTTSSGAVIQEVDAGFFTAPPKAHPSRVYVVSYRDGHLRSFSGAPSATERIASKFCYLVDTSEQYASSTCTVTSAVDAYSFLVELTATWRVADPEAAVRANLSDGNRLVLGSLQDTVWQIARGFQPDRAAAAESAARARLEEGILVGAGITMLRAVARFRADAAVTKATVSRDTAAHEGILERERMALLRDMFDGTEASALMLHLLRHPEDTGSALTTLKDNREKEQALRLALQNQDRQHYLAMLDRALDNNLINDADAQPLRDLLFGQSAGAGLAGSVAMVPIAAKPGLSLPPGVTASGTAAALSHGSPGSAQAAGRQASSSAPPVVPGYVVEDVPVSGPVEDAGANAPGQADPASPGSAPGGVREWKPLKNRDQGGK